MIDKRLCEGLRGHLMWTSFLNRYLVVLVAYLLCGILIVLRCTHQFVIACSFIEGLWKSSRDVVKGVNVYALCVVQQKVELWALLTHYFEI